MAIFKSRQVNLDPEPYECDGARATRNAYLALGPAQRKASWMFAPRAEYEPTRDPYPMTSNGARTTRRLGLYIQGHSSETGARVEWCPRREQFDTPVNPILTWVRSASRQLWTRPAAHIILNWDETVGAAVRANIIAEPTTEQVEHARRVLTRLAEWRIEGGLMTPRHERLLARAQRMLDNGWPSDTEARALIVALMVALEEKK